MIEVQRTRLLPLTFRFIKSTVLTFVLITLAACGGGSSLGTASIPFTVTVSPGSLAIKAGGAALYTVAVSPAAMIGSVNLSTSALPAGVNATFGSEFNALQGSKTLYIMTTEDTPETQAEITIYASDSTGNTHSAQVALTIDPAADFTLSVTPQSQQIKPGGTAQYTVNVTLAAGASGPVALSAQNLPAGTTASFSPSSLTASGTATLTITSDPTASTTQTSVGIAGTDASGTYTASANLIIAPADFSITTAATPLEIDAGGSFTGNLSIQGLFAGTPGTVSLFASNVPPGMSVSFNPTTVTGAAAATFSIATDGTMQPGTYSVAIEGTDSSGTNAATVQVVVAAGTAGAGVYLAVTPLVENITAGTTASFNVFVSGPEASAPLSASVDQPDVQASVDPVPGQPGLYQLNVASDASLVLSETATATVTASGSNGNQSLSVQVQITPPPENTDSVSTPVPDPIVTPVPDPITDPTGALFHGETGSF